MSDCANLMPGDQPSDPIEQGPDFRKRSWYVPSCVGIGPHYPGWRYCRGFLRRVDNDALYWKGNAAVRTIPLTEILLVIATLSIVVITIAIGHIAGWW